MPSGFEKLDIARIVIEEENINGLTAKPTVVRTSEFTDYESVTTYLGMIVGR